MCHVSQFHQDRVFSLRLISGEFDDVHTLYMRVGETEAGGKHRRSRKGFSFFPNP